MSIRGKLLVIDDEKAIRDSIELFFRRFGLEVRSAGDAQEAFTIIPSFRPDIVISDIRLPGMNGLDVLERLKREYPDLPVVMMTAYDNMENAIQSIQKGAFDYIEKPIDTERLSGIIETALKNKHLGARVDNLTAHPSIPTSERPAARLIGKSPAMKLIYKKIGQVTNTRVTVLIQGESGTGKELIARVIHDSGVTGRHPFIAVNCAVLPETLLESELFGHVRGAFTGAYRDKPGKFTLAGEGTIFLDDIAGISPAFQMKLLRVIQEREFECVGGEKTLKMGARVIAATNRRLEDLVSAGTFREDLYYRLNVLRIDVPPLRERREDIPLLVMHFLQRYNTELHRNVHKVPYCVIERLQRYSWPGNVRELENVVLRAVIASRAEVLEPEAVPEIGSADTAGEGERSGYCVTMSMEELEKMHIARVLEYVRGNRTKACSLLGISRPTLNRKLKAFGMERRAR
ncbi:MAG: sigma-54 dependent transcriptional regulator [Bacteroidota bacterium]|nr:sigma-54 dependent transcriptional regulator [Bacteroidota bacterium]